MEIGIIVNENVPRNVTRDYRILPVRRR